MLSGARLSTWGGGRRAGGLTCPRLCCCLALGLRPQAKRALRRERRFLDDVEEFPCEITARLNDAVVTKFMPGARCGGTWARTQSWLSKFYVFARKICKQSGQIRSDLQCLSSNVMCRHFITAVAGEFKGSSRPRSARAVLSAERQRRGWASLNSDRAIAAVVSGAESAAPYTKKQSAGLTLAMVRCIIRKWGRSGNWFYRQVVTVVATGFVSIMRLGELCSLLRSGVVAVFKDGSERPLCRMRKMPTARELKGLLLHLPWRKNHRAQDCYVPVACPKAVQLLLNQYKTLRRHGSKSRYVFPSRRGRHMNKRNHVGQQSMVRALQHALRECVPLMTRKWSKCYTGHSLRVGGSNHMRKSGIADDVHRRLGGWMTLVAAQGYIGALTSRAVQVHAQDGQGQEEVRSVAAEGATGVKYSAVARLDWMSCLYSFFNNKVPKFSNVQSNSDSLGRVHYLYQNGICAFFSVIHKQYISKYILF